MLESPVFDSYLIGDVHILSYFIVVTQATTDVLTVFIELSA